MAEDYYQLLEVSKGAPADEIKKSYRKLARKYHPDMNPGNKQAEEQFKKISLAFDVLSNEKKRKLYDEFGEDAERLGFDEQKAEAFRAYRQQGSSSGGGMPFGGFGGRQQGQQEVDLGDLFGELFGRQGRGGGGGGFGGFDGDPFSSAGRPQGPSRGDDLTTRTRVTLAEAVTGTERSLSVTRPVTCRTCQGKGAVGKPTQCKTCSGTGRARRRVGPLQMAGACPTCNGTGVSADPCAACSGEGVVEDTQRLTVKIPPGVQTGSQVRLSSQGAAGTRGGPAGDLYIEVEVTPHPWVRREGDDLYADLPITVPEAVRGAEVQVPTFTGNVTVTIRPGSQSGRKMRLKGKGVPSLKGGAVGDLYLVLRVMVPDELNPEIEQAAEVLSRGYKADVRNELKI